MFLKLIRKPPEGEWLRGTLYSLTPIPSPKGEGRSEGCVKESFICDTLERTSKAILSLIYPVQVTQSPKFKRLLPILNNVPSSPSEGGTRGSRQGIRIHVGTKPEHSSGCILVPNRQIEGELTQLLLAAQREHEDIRLDISNFRPEYTDAPCPAHECAMRNHELDKL